jgi:hypothetical protein
MVVQPIWGLLRRIAPLAPTTAVREPARLERLALYVVVAVPIAFNALALLPELLVSVANINDDAFHWAFIQRGIDALARGENVLEFWVPQLGLGFPQFLYYQSLPHLFVIFLHRVLFGAVDPYTLFNLVRYLLLVMFPLTVSWSLRRMDLSLPAAAFAAAASSLLNTPYLYGFDYDSYIFRGFGMYTQLVAMHLSFITMALLYRLAQRGTGYTAAALALAALGLSHILYAYMAVITAGVVFLVGLSRGSLIARAARLLFVGASALAITAYSWIPTAGSASLYLDRSPYLESWKYDSFGAAKVIEYLVTGDLFDSGRMPVLTILVLVGVIAALLMRTRAAITLVALFVVWLVLFFGRPTLGPLAELFPLKDSLYFHRFIGAVHLAAIPLIGLAGAWLWERARSLRPRWELGAAALLLVLLVPALLERQSYYGQNAEWLRATDAAIRGDADAQQMLAMLETMSGARTYAGLRTNWGSSLNFGLTFNSTRFYNVLTARGLPEVAQPYSGPSLNSDLQYDFDGSRPEHYDLFDARYVVAPTAEPMPGFLRPLARTPRYTLYEAPTTGIAEYVAIGDRRAVSSQASLFPQNRAWLASRDVAAKRFIRWDYPASTDRSLGEAKDGCPDGATSYERVQPSRVDLIVQCRTSGTLVIKVTYHPNWIVTVDGAPAATFMLSPSYLGVELPPGQHFVAAEYRSTPAKTPLLLVGALGLLSATLGGWWLERRRGRRSAE